MNLRDWQAEHDQGKELTAYDGGKWSRGWWLDWTGWGLGVEVSREFGGAIWPERLYFRFQIGPLTYGAIRTWGGLDE